MLIAILFWVIGIIVTSFTLISVCIILFFGIPTARRMTHEGLLIKPNPIIKRYLISILLLTGIFTVISSLIYFFGSNQSIPGYFGGVIFALLIGIWKTGTNKDNVSDFLETNERYLVKTN